jgi:hypothetical protein
MPSKQKEQKSEVITINKTSLNIDNFDTLTLEELLAFIDTTFENISRILTTPLIVT